MVYLRTFVWYASPVGLHFQNKCSIANQVHLFYPQTPCKISVSETFHLKPTQKPLRYRLRSNSTKSSISPLFTPSKITTYNPKIPSKTYKLRLQSNSAKNHTQSTKFHLTNHQKSNIKITQNTSKINAFTLHQTHKQHHSIEVIFFTIKFTSKLTSKK